MAADGNGSPPRKRNWAAFLVGQPDEADATSPEPTAAADPASTEPTAPPQTAASPGDAAPRQGRPSAAAASVAVRPAPASYPPGPPSDDLFEGIDDDDGYYEEYDEYADDSVEVEVEDPADWVRYPRRSRAGLRFAVLGFFVLVGLIAVRGWVVGWVDGQVVPSGPQGEEIEFTIEPGWPTNRVAEALVSENVIGNSTVFRYWLRCPALARSLVGLECDGEITDSFQAGDYLLYENMAYADIVAVFEQGPIPEVFTDVNVPEGLRFTQIVDRLVKENPSYDAEEMVAAFGNDRLTSRFLPEGQPFKWMEGLLFPATYQVDEEHLTDELDILVRMADTMEQRFDASVSNVGRAPEIDELGLTDYEILTIASLIEEEAKVPEERPKIARVIYNRLLTGETLGIDASLLYTVAPGSDPNSLNHLEDPSPYNLRNHQGLPPSPISAPGQASIEAALAPEPGPWVFYVLVDEDGTHAFAETNAEHEANVAICREKGLC